MKHVLTLTALLISSLAMGQFPNLPYNPDDNADGLIGVADLQALLANYGSTFEGAILSTDSNTAVVEVGSMNYLTCRSTCAALPGVWDIIDDNSAGLILPTLTSDAWLNLQSYNYSSGSGGGAAYAYVLESDGDTDSIIDVDWDYTLKCFCAAKQRPRVEWSYCEHYGAYYFDALPSNIEDCYNQKLEEGWYPLGGPSVGQSSISQSFLRWAE